MKKVKKKKSKRRPSSKKHKGSTVQRSCGLCGKTKKLIKTECCDRWICDDGDQYIMFSYARNSCHRNHDRYTLCGFHYNEGHSGDWKNCPECRDSFPTEIYIYYGTNEYNFEKLEDVPDYEPTKCSKCNAVIVLSDGGYSSRGDEYFCARCTDFDGSGF